MSVEERLSRLRACKSRTSSERRGLFAQANRPSSQRSIATRAFANTFVALLLWH